MPRSGAHPKPPRSQRVQAVGDDAEIVAVGRSRRERRGQCAHRLRACPI